MGDTGNSTCDCTKQHYENLSILITQHDIVTGYRPHCENLVDVCIDGELVRSKEFASESQSPRKMKKRRNDELIAQNSGNRGRRKPSYLPGDPDDPKNKKRVAVTGVPKFDARLPVLYIDRTWILPNERQMILNHLGTISSDTLEIRDEPAKYPSWFSVYVKTKGTGKPLGTELVRSMQEDPSMPVKVIVRPDTTGMPAACDISIQNGQLGIGLQLSANAPKVFTRPPSIPFSNPQGTTVQEFKWFVALAHEMIHALHKITEYRTHQALPLLGNPRNVFFDEYQNRFEESILEEETRTVGLNNYANERITENTIRKENGIDVRIAYVAPEYSFEGRVHKPTTPPDWWPDYPINKHTFEVKLTKLEIVDDDDFWFSADWCINFQVNKKSVMVEFRAVNTEEVIYPGWVRTVEVWGARKLSIDIIAGIKGSEATASGEYSGSKWGEGTQQLTSTKGLFKAEVTITRLSKP